MTQPSIPQDVMEVAAAIERDIPSRITGADRVFIRAIIARAIMAAKAEELSACVSIVQEVGTEWGALEAKQACEEAVFLMLGRAD